MINRGSYMSAHVLLNLLNEFNKFNNTRARMLDSISHMTLRYLFAWRYFTPRRDVI